MTGTVYVIDDDAAVRESLALLVRSVGLESRTFVSAADFLAAFDAAMDGCLVVDIRMPGMSGLDLQQVLNERGCHLPLLFITGHGDVAMAVRAMRAGALDFIEKPFRDQELLDRINQALALSARQRSAFAQVEEVRARLSTLTTREREIMDRIVTGQANKVIAMDLGLSERTVEIHRAKVMTKTQVHSLAELVTLITRAR
jgi:FixJ family two-component response regulator